MVIVYCKLIICLFVRAYYGYIYIIYITIYETMHNILFLLKFSQLKVTDSQETIKPIAVKFTEFVRLIIRAITTWKVLVTQSSNIVHCNWHTQKPTCAKFQGFSNTFSLLKFTLFSCQGSLFTTSMPMPPLPTTTTTTTTKIPTKWSIFLHWLYFFLMGRSRTLFGTRIKYHYKVRYKLHLTNCQSDKLLTTTIVIGMPKTLYARTFKWFRAVLPGQKSFVYF